MVKALIHRYDNEPDMLAIGKNRCTDVFNHVNDDNFELVIVVPTTAAKTDIVILAEALSGQYKPDEQRAWPGKPARYVWRVDVGIIKQTNLTLIKQAFSEADLNWGGAWTVRNVSLPDWVGDLLDGDESPEEASALEGLFREQTGYTRTRDRRLRNQALALSKGVCEVCDVDFSKLLNGCGIRALQVHHRNQLALSDMPVVTKLSDLAVVCANCHALIHTDRSKALEVAELKQLLGRG